MLKWLAQHLSLLIERRMNLQRTIVSLKWQKQCVFITLSWFTVAKKEAFANGNLQWHFSAIRLLMKLKMRSLETKHDIMLEKGLPLRRSFYWKKLGDILLVASAWMRQPLHQPTQTWKQIRLIYCPAHKKSKIFCYVQCKWGWPYVLSQQHFLIVNGVT